MTYLLGALVTFAVQWAIHGYGSDEPFDWQIGAVMNLLAWPVMLGWTLFWVGRGMMEGVRNG